MLLQQIVTTLDAEVARLQLLRSLVAGLASSPINLVPVPDGPGEDISPALLLPEQVAAVVTRLPPSRRGGRRTRSAKSRPMAPPPVALSGLIPTGPVVVGAEVLARESAKRSAQKTAAPERPALGTLGAMIKALELKTGT